MRNTSPKLNLDLPPVFETPAGLLIACPVCLAMLAAFGRVGLVTVSGDLDIHYFILKGLTIILYLYINTQISILKYKYTLFDS